MGLVSPMQPIGVIKFAVWKSFAVTLFLVAIVLLFCVFVCFTSLCCRFVLFLFFICIYIVLPSGVIKKEKE